MEKTYDIHVHYSFDIPIDVMIKTFKEEFEETGTEKYAFLSLPTHAKDHCLYYNANQNVKGLYLKNALSPNAYAFAGLVHPEIPVSDEERTEAYYNQAVKYFSAGYDGIKMLEGYPDLRKALKIALDSPVYDKFYSYLEEVGMPVLMHVANPAGYWNWETASESAKKLGRVYVGDFPSKRQLTDEVFGIMYKHPKLKLVLAHFGFMSDDMSEAERFLSYENTRFDLTPGGEEILSISENWEKWKPFFNKYQDRLIYGSDFYAFPKDDLTEWRKCFNSRPAFLRQFLETDTEHFYVDTGFKGVKLDKSIRDKLYRENFIKLLGTPKIIDLSYLECEIKKLQANPPSGNSYYTKQGVIDITIPENLKFVRERYRSDLAYMLKNL